MEESVEDENNNDFYKELESIYGTLSQNNDYDKLIIE